MRLILVGEESAGVQTLREVEQLGHELVAAMTSRHDADDDPVGALARRMGIPTWPARQVRIESFADQVAELEVDLLLNVHSLHVIHEAVVNAPRIGSFNLHPGPLPEYAGLDVVSWALLNGEEHHGVTLHWMDKGIDTGAIAYAAEFPLSEDDTALTVYAKCLEHGIPLVRELLDAAASDPESIPHVAQNLSQRRYYTRQYDGVGLLHWSQPARTIVNFIRACDYHPFRSPWRHPVSQLNYRPVQIIKAARTHRTTDEPPGTIAEDDDGIVVAAGDEWVSIQLVQFAGKATEARNVLTPGQVLKP